MTEFKTISPVDNSVYFKREYDSIDDVKSCLDQAKASSKKWQQLSIRDRAQYLSKFVDYIVMNKSDIAQEICWQIGRPAHQAEGEINGFEERARYMIDIAEQSLSHVVPDEKQGFERWIERCPLGVVCILSPWNYPYLTSVNSIVPALMAGNVVILKHSAQTPLTTKRYLEAAKYAGLPEGVFQGVFLSHQDTSLLIADNRVDGVFFTGSVSGGKIVQKALTEKFVACGLELGGKDAAYVREDADLDNVAGNLVDGAFFNSGQSCCGIERIYVHESVFNDFVKKFKTLTQGYTLGNPTDKNTNIGPMVKASSAQFVREQIQEAVAQGAQALIDEKDFIASKEGTPYLAPQVLIDVNHSMRIMTEESFGPVVGIMSVANDDEAVALINDSEYGLTASIWGRDINKAKSIAPKLEVGTVFFNRCDYLDPALAWTGVKNTGKGVTLSALGYEHVSRVKSYHFRTQ